jgi:hypothetical protein
VFLAFLVLLGWFGVEALGFLPTLTATIHNLHRGGNGSFTATTAGTPHNHQCQCQCVYRFHQAS